MSDRSRGFTLIELMIVIAILGLSFDILFSYFPVAATVSRRERITDGLCRAARITSALDHLSHVSLSPAMETDTSGEPVISAAGPDGRWTLGNFGDGMIRLAGSGRTDISVSGSMACGRLGDSLLVTLDLTEPGIPCGEGTFAFFLTTGNEERM